MNLWNGYWFDWTAFWEATLLGYAPLLVYAVFDWVRHLTFGWRMVCELRNSRRPLRTYKSDAGVQKIVTDNGTHEAAYLPEDIWRAIKKC